MQSIPKQTCLVRFLLDHPVREKASAIYPPTEISDDGKKGEIYSNESHSPVETRRIVQKEVTVRENSRHGRSSCYIME